MAQKWLKEMFQRKRYTVEGDTLDKARSIQLYVVVDDKVMVNMQAREPGILAFVSKPEEQGFDIEVIEASQVAFTDRALPEFEGPEALADWQAEALDLG